MNATRHTALIAGVLAITLSRAQSAEPARKDTSAADTQLFELSIGHSLLFISDSRVASIRKHQDVVVPTNAILLFVEFRPEKRMRIPVFANIPTETKKFIVDNQLVSERASPTFGAGVEFRLFTIAIGKKSRLEFEAGPLASFLLDEHNALRFAPVAAGRFRFLKNGDFVIYAGSSYSAGVDAFGLLLGTGYVF